MGVEQCPLDGRGDGDRVARRAASRLPVDIRGDPVGVGSGARDHGPGGLGEERRPQQMFGVEVGTAVFGGVGGGGRDEMPRVLTHQPAEVDMP
ncbi:hypothetical protein GCM10017744_014210 [Streptomyces antimycoticus]